MDLGAIGSTTSAETAPALEGFRMTSPTPTSPVISKKRKEREQDIVPEEKQKKTKKQRKESTNNEVSGSAKATGSQPNRASVQGEQSKKSKTLTLTSSQVNGIAEMNEIEEPKKKHKEKDKEKKKKKRDKENSKA